MGEKKKPGRKKGAILPRSNHGRFAGSERKVSLTLLISAQNVEEEKQFAAALDIFLSELAKQHLTDSGGSNAISTS